MMFGNLNYIRISAREMNFCRGQDLRIGLPEHIFEPIFSKLIFYKYYAVFLSTARNRT